MDKIPEDRLVVDAIQLKKDMFTSRFVKNNDPTEWGARDHWYFKHVCEVLNHAKILFQADIDSLATKTVEISKET
jgi:hypothetical protein